MKFTDKYRPKTFDQVFGNEVVKKLLENSMKRGDSKVYLLEGERGCGKTTLARICANYKKSEIKEYNIANKGLKDFARYLESMTEYKSWSGNPTSVILDEAQEAKSGFYNVMLKPLEEGPDYYYWFICTTHPVKIPKAIKSRCSIHKIKPLSVEQSGQLIAYVLKKEGKQLKPNIVEAIIKNANCIPREMLQLLQDVIDLDDEQLSLEHIGNRKDIPQSEAKELFKALQNGSWKQIKKILNGLKKSEAENYRYYLLTCFSNQIGWEKNGAREEKLFDQMEYFLETFMYSGFSGLQSACRNAWEEGR